MNQLQVINKNGRLSVDSREVAEKSDTRHDHLLAKIEGYVKVLSTDPNFRVSDFFLESTYQDSTGRTLKCFLLTRIGCDMVANKMTGTKGVLFTATYAIRFSEMEQQLISQNTPSYMIPDPVERAKKWISEEESRQTLETKSLMLEQRVSEYEPKITYLDRILGSKGTVTITQIAKDYDLTGPSLNKMLHEERVQYKQNRQWLLYANHLNKGYTKSETIDITRSNGDPDVTLNTRWTQKGRLFIHELLSKRGILPYMDRVNIGA